MTLSYEEQRLQNIKANEDLLTSLGLAVVKPPPKKVVARKYKSSEKTKRKAAEAEFTPKAEEEDDDEAESGTKRRRSSRVKKVLVTSDSEEEYTPRKTKTRDVQVREKLVSLQEEPQRRAQKLGERTEDPKQFGHIPGVPIGKWWASRMDCSTDAVHAPTVAGISGNADVGAWSVALSGGYADDVDMGEAFTYTGSGGRDLKGTKNAPKNLRTAPQTKDQSFDHNYNAALKKSAETGKLVRVIRGFKLDSVYAPLEGYRYDGLYTVEKAWMAPGLTNGLKVCRYAFKRVEGQPPLPVQGGSDDEADDAVEEVDETEKEVVKKEEKPKRNGRK